MNRRRNRNIALAVSFVLAVLAVAVATRASAPADDTRGASPATTITATDQRAPEALGPRGSRLGVPTGWRHDTAGATAAAIGYIESTGLVARAGPLARRDVVLVLATEAYGPELVERTNRQLDDLLYAFGERGLTAEDLIWSEHALTTHVERGSADRVDLRVWSVVVLAARGGSVPRQLWRTTSLTLVWSHGDWKVEAWDSETGPTPAPPGEADVATVQEIVGVTAWTPARSVGGGR